MNIEKQNILIVISGPTAVGKTALAIKIARAFNTEIVSADSRQFYKEMSIGTAKPSRDELEQAKHHFIDSISIHQDYSVGDYEREALSLLNRLFETKRVVVLTGGSGLYIKAVTEGFDDLPKVPSSVRERLNLELSEKGLLALSEELRRLDPLYYDSVDIKNPHRIIRALEVIRTTGKPFSSYRIADLKPRSFNRIHISLTLERAELYERINQRVDQMMRQGLLEEARGLVPFSDLNALSTVGYTELFDYFNGASNLEEAVGLIKQNTRRFAKRQLTWFRRDPSIEWFQPCQVDAIINYIKTRLD